MTGEELYIFLDSETLDDSYFQNRHNTDRLLSCKGPFNITRSVFAPKSYELVKITQSRSDKRISESKLQSLVRNSILTKPLTQGQNEFLHMIVKYASTHKDFNRTYISNAIFVTENPCFLEKLISRDREIFCLRDFFPTLRLVNVNQALEICDIFAKSKGLYFGTRSGVDVTPWYQLYLFSKLTHCPVAYQNSFINSNPSEVVKALVFRFLKVLLCIDYLGQQHYFAQSIKQSIDTEQSKEGLDILKQEGRLDPEKLKGIINLGDSLIIFYHMEYLISLVTGIFDNLAIESSNLYNISFPQQIKISLSNIAGRDFLREIKTKNPTLKNHIDNNRNFINLIYEFREKVIHREGLERKIAPLVAHWSNFIEINRDIKNYIKNCGDHKSIYKHITKWGIVEKQGNNYLDPFYFAKKVVLKLIEFSDEYLYLIGNSKFSDYIDEQHKFVLDLKYFQNNGLTLCPSP
jgi:hypothetical protein